MMYYIILALVLLALTVVLVGLNWINYILADMRKDIKFLQNEMDWVLSNIGIEVRE